MPRVSNSEHQGWGCPQKAICRDEAVKSCGELGQVSGAGWGLVRRVFKPETSGGDRWKQEQASSAEHAAEGRGQKS